MVNIYKVKKSYTGEPIFNEFSCFINHGEKIGVVGPNGSGKTTLLNLIAKLEVPDSGEISISKNTEIGLLRQIPKENEELRVYDILEGVFEQLNQMKKKIKEFENDLSTLKDPLLVEKTLIKYGESLESYERLGGYLIETRIKEVINGLGLAYLLNNKYATLSGGEKTKIELAKILIKSPPLILLDEPTNHLDIYAIEWLEIYIKKTESTVIFVSHDKEFLQNVSERIIDIDDGEVKSWSFSYKNFIKEKEIFLLSEFNRYSEQQKRIKKMKESIKQLRDWANRTKPPSAALHRRATNMERALERMKKISKPKLENDVLRSDFIEANKGSKDIVVIENGSKKLGNKVLFESLNLIVRRGQKISIVGKNGAGKSTLIKCILGEYDLDSGESILGEDISIGYINQNGIESKNDHSVISYFRDEINSEEGEARKILAKYLFYGSDVFKKVNSLSGGERMRLRLAQLMQQPLNVLILDEPTNHLDMESQEILEKCISDFSGTILCVSHDRSLLENFDTTLWIKDNKVIQFHGPYSYAKSKMENEIY